MPGAMMVQGLVIWSIVLAGASLAAATSEAPLFWDEIRVSTDDRGGAEVVASLSSAGHLNAIAISIQGRKVEIPIECLPTETPILLNDLAMVYGEFSDEGPYWDVNFSVDESASFDGVGKFHLILLPTRVHSSYIEVRESENATYDVDMCSS